jgi:diketogulonate reductase-like aldo/keto reductase
LARHSHDEGHDEDQHNPLVTKPSRQFDFSGGEYVKLSNDVEMPIVLFGTAALKDPGSVIPYSLQLGLKGLDTASDVGPWYKTEGLIGQLIKDYELHRSDYFFVTKLHPSQHGYDSALKAVDASLKNLQSSYIDLYLIHYPNCFGDLCKTEPEGTWKDSWRAMEMLYKQKKLRALGVSNFQLDQLKELKRIANVQPHVGTSTYRIRLSL